jgi:hypothetical protein
VRGADQAAPLTAVSEWRCSLQVAVGIGIGRLIDALRIGVFPLLLGERREAAMNVDPARAGAISSIIGGATFSMGAIVASVAGYLHDGAPRPLAGLISS